MKLNRLGLLLFFLASVNVAYSSENIPAGTSSALVTAERPTIFRSGAIERSDAKRASDLLERAVDYLQTNGPEKAFGAFSERKSDFVSNEFYVFVIGTDGVLKATGGDPNWLVNLSALDMHDAAGKYFVREMLDVTKTKESGTIEYNWLNHIDNRVEIKTTQFRKVGNFIVCVGYYIPRASIEEAAALLDKAVAMLKKSGGTTTFKVFNDPKGGYVINDEYVFAIGLDGKYRASGAAPHLTGTDVLELTDVAGKPFFREMIEIAKRNGSGSVDYLWRNPATNAVEQKHSLIQRVDDVLLGVGYYTKK
jgi:cytochrome c